MALKETVTTRQTASALLIPRDWLEKNPEDLVRLRGKTIWVLGGSFLQTEQLRSCLGDSAIISSIGPRLTAVLDRFSKDIVNLDERLAIDPADVRWRYSDVAERGPYNTDLMQEICRAIACLEILQEGGEHVFIVDKPSTSKALYEVGCRAGFNIESVPRRTDFILRQKARDFGAGLRGIAARARGASGLLLRLRTVRALRRRHPLKMDALRSADTLMLVWTRAGTFTAGARVLKTENFGQLPQIMRANGARIAFLSHAISWLGSFAKIARNAVSADEPVLLFEDCLTARDVIRATTMRRRPRIGQPLVLNGWNLSPVLTAELVREGTKWRSAMSGLYATVAPRLAKMGLCPKTVIYSFENQSFEKALIDGFRTAMPDVRLVGIQNSTFAENYLCFYPSRSDIARGLTPDFLVTSGRHARALFARHGFPDDRMASAAYRYDLTALRAIAKPLKPAGRPVVLCATAVGYDETLELLVKTARALSARADVDLIVNFHPVTDAAFRVSLRRDLDALVGTLRCGLRFSESGIRDLLPLADVLVYNSSGASFEALAAGIPVVFVGRDSTIDFDKVPVGMGSRCWTANELTGVLADLLAHPAHERLPAGLSEALTHWFAPADPSSVAGWIEIPEKPCVNP